jgi:hypothetical protein
MAVGLGKPLRYCFDDGFPAIQESAVHVENESDFGSQAGLAGTS